MVGASLDIATLFIIAAGIFGAAAGKIAAKKDRFWPAWCIIGALLMPIGLAAALLVPKLDRCPSCGRYAHITANKPCRRCGWAPPKPLERGRIDSSIKLELGFRLGDSASRICSRLDKRGIAYRRTSSSELAFTDTTAPEDRAPDVVVELDRDRAALIRVVYPIDPEYKIYYELKAHLVSKFGRPAYENFDDGYSDNWSAGGLLVSLETAAKDGGAPETAVVYQKMEKNIAAAVADHSDRRADR